MSDSKMVAGWYLPTGINVTPKPVVIPADDWKKMAAMIGGGCQYIDCVRVGAYNTDTEESYVLVGYVDDDGFANGQEPNFLATVMFQRSEFIVGDCYVVNGNNPETGEYDGDVYDIPDAVTESALDELEMLTAKQYNWMVMMYASAQVAIDRGVLDKDDFDILDDPDKQEDMMQFLQEYAMTVVNSMDSGDDDLDDIIDTELRGILDGN